MLSASASGSTWIGAVSQVSLTLATLGKPGKEWNDALGYDLSKDALRFLQSVNFPKGKQRPGTGLGFVVFL